MKKKISLSTSLLFLLLCLLLIFQGYRAFSYQKTLSLQTRAELFNKIDYRWIYTSGQCWRNGLNPHIPKNFQKVWKTHFPNSDKIPTCNPYPPNLALVAVPITFLPPKEALKIYDSMNYLAFILSIFFLYQIFSKKFYFSSLNRTLIALCLSAGLGAITASLYTGQTPLFALCGGLGAFYFSEKKSLWIASLCILFGFIKPQISFFMILFVCLSHPGLIWRTIVLETILILVTSGSFLDVHFIHNYLQSTKINYSFTANVPSQLSLGQQILNLLGSSDTNRNNLILIPLGISLSIISWYFLKYKHKKNLQDYDLTLGYLYALGGVISFIFFPLHDYDHVILMLPLMVMGYLRSSYLFISLPFILMLARPNIGYGLLEKIIPLHLMIHDPKNLVFWVGSPFLIFLFSWMMFRHMTTKPKETFTTD